MQREQVIRDEFAQIGDVRFHTLVRGGQARLLDVKRSLATVDRSLLRRIIDDAGGETNADWSEEDVRHHVRETVRRAIVSTLDRKLRGSSAEITEDQVELVPRDPTGMSDRELIIHTNVERWRIYRDVTLNSTVDWEPWSELIKDKPADARASFEENLAQAMNALIDSGQWTGVGDKWYGITALSGTRHYMLVHAVTQPGLVLYASPVSLPWLGEIVDDEDSTKKAADACYVAKHPRSQV